jgi:hypothetical protein
MRKCPLPQAGSQILRDRMACSGEVVRWPDGEVVRWPDGEVVRWPDGDGVSRLPFKCCFNYRLQCRIQQAINQRRRGVITAGGLAFGSGNNVEFEITASRLISGCISRRDFID